ncbi:MAG: UDP-N-acetylmuramoyl-L-alanine--D-glutamate ligase [Mycobacteriales bacterium]
MSWATRTVCVAGLAVSGMAAAQTLLGLGAAVVVVDRRDAPDEQARAAALTALGASVVLGPDGADRLPPGTDLVITSPGWRPDAPLLLAAVAAGVPVWGDVELAWRLRAPDGAPWLALTGTNGKTTTVRMLAAMLTAAGHRSVAVGNVGVPVVTAALAHPAYDVLAVELSSFQLHWAQTVAPAVGAVLNVAPDHLDWHGSFEAYGADKAKVWHGAGVAVGNADEPVSAGLLAHAAGRHTSFTLGRPRTGQLGIADGMLVDRAFADGAALAPVASVRPAGPHNVANALAAAAMARAYGVAPAAVADGLAGYTPDRHRNELVATVGGVGYVDDSKATNPHAAAASLGAYPSVVWIAGGLDKGLSFEDLVATAGPGLRAAVVLGTCRGLLRDALSRHAPQVPVIELLDMETAVMEIAVRAAARVAQPGDTVLLAPAAASMDIWNNYGERGDAFAAAVQALSTDRAQ